MNTYLLGATGFTGKILLPRLIEQGLNPIAVGRSREKLEELRKNYPDLQVQQADVQNPDQLGALIRKGDLVISTVGPFTELGEVPLQVAVRKKAHYLDSTGEPAFMHEVYTRYEHELQNSRQLIMTACGYDYVPGQFLASQLMQAYGDKTVALDIAYSTPQGQIAQLSSGTFITLIRALYDHGTFFNQGQWYSSYIGTRAKKIITKKRKITAVSLAGCECLELPRTYPQLMDVNVYLGWFGSLGGIVSGINKIQHQLFKLPMYKKLIKSLVSKISVPRRNEKSVIKGTRSNVFITADAVDKTGGVLATARLEGHNMYEYTVDIMAWMAKQVCAGEIKQYGVIGPERAFGAEALEKAHQKMGMHWSVSAA